MRRSLVFVVSLLQPMLSRVRPGRGNGRRERRTAVERPRVHSRGLTRTTRPARRLPSPHQLPSHRRTPLALRFCDYVRDGRLGIGLPRAAASARPPPSRPFAASASALGNRRRSKDALPRGGCGRAPRRPRVPRAPEPRDFRVRTATHQQTKLTIRISGFASSSRRSCRPGRWRGRRRTWL